MLELRRDGAGSTKACWGCADGITNMLLPREMDRGVTKRTCLCSPAHARTHTHKDVVSSCFLENDGPELNVSRRGEPPSPFRLYVVDRGRQGVSWIQVPARP